jgi:two-component system sensor histidine kinase ResE
MIVELLENAEKFTPPGGCMGLRIGPAGPAVRIDVWDTGPGISEEDFPRIWEAFSQLAVGDAVRKAGLGLGLTIVKKLAELHGGKVAVVSQPGRGTTFSITLPLAGLPEPEAPATGKSATDEPHAGEPEAGASGPGEAEPPPTPGR